MGCGWYEVISLAAGPSPLTGEADRLIAHQVQRHAGDYVSADGCVHGPDHDGLQCPEHGDGDRLGVRPPDPRTLPLAPGIYTAGNSYPGDQKVFLEPFP